MQRGGSALRLLLAGSLLAGACATASRYRIPDVTLPPPTSSVTTVVAADFDVPEGAILVQPGDDLAGLVAEAPAGTTFVLAPGVHRMGPLAPKDRMVFEGIDGAVLSGAVILDGFVAEGSRWVLEDVDLDPARPGECIPDYRSCGLRNDVFVDGVMLWRVDTEAEVRTGTWWGGDGRIVLADDPTGRVVEVSVRSHAILGAADEVTIRNLVVEKYATPPQHGAVQAQELGDGPRGWGWLVEDVELRLNHAVGLRTGDATTVRRVYAHHNGQLGISVSGGSGVRIEESDLSFNNTRGFLWEWEGGGGKFTRTDGLVVVDTTAIGNEGPGLWTDIDAVDTRYEGNVVRDNRGPGIFHEISGAAVIRGNEVVGNGFGKPAWAWGAGILVAASFDVEVSGNVVRGNADGVVGVQQERGSGPLGPRLLARLVVEENTIGLTGGIVGVVDDVGDRYLYIDRGIRFEGNHYEGIGDRRLYAWAGGYHDREGWQALGHDLTGTWED
ncbi:MAG TPA: right-handed parallel beta-helix repeat-containing protein [Actinobacteria bacterium]|nr:right-handed parallel beta-helix repeat-containing protein [Actinomycetota bacterium]